MKGNNPSAPTPQADSDDDLFFPIEKTWTTEELAKEIDDLKYHPLFIKPGQDFKETPELLALQNILYNEDDHTLALNFCNAAGEILNGSYATAKDKDSQVFYLKQALAKINEAIPMEKNDAQLMIRLLSNRSFVNGKLRKLIRKLWESDRRLLQNYST
jgi:hypothetical protein